MLPNEILLSERHGTSKTEQMSITKTRFQLIPPQSMLQSKSRKVDRTICLIQLAFAQVLLIEHIV